MNNARFWQIIEESRPSRDSHPEECEPRLIEILRTLDANEIVAWNQIFDQRAKDAYTIDQLGACYLINGGAGDDGFYYYRCWLIGMGQAVYENALCNPDSLADVLSGDEDAEAEIYAAAHSAWMAVTSNSELAPYPARNEKAEMQGDDWDFDNETEVRGRMPRLAEMYWR